MFLDYPSGPSVIPRFLLEGVQRARVTEDVRMETEVRVTQAHEARNGEWPLGAEKGKKRDSPLESPEGTGPLNPFWTSDF